MRYLSIKNHKAHQHYKDRRPPWIKLHVAILDDYAFSCLQDASKAHLLLLNVLASKMDNRIPFDADFLARKLGATEPVDVEVLVSHGFVDVSEDDASTPLARRKQMPIVETETETEREAEKKGASAPTRLRALSPAWVAEGVEWWLVNVGATTPAKFQKGLGVVVGLHSWEKLFPDLREWALSKVRDGRPAKPEWYAEVASGRLAPKPPMVDEFGVMTAYGERMTRPVSA